MRLSVRCGSWFCQGHSRTLTSLVRCYPRGFLLYVLDHCLQCTHELQHAFLQGLSSFPFFKFSRRIPKRRCCHHQNSLQGQSSIWVLPERIAEYIACFPYRVNRGDVLKNGHAAVVHVITMNGVKSLKKIHYTCTTKVHMSCVLYSKSPEDIQWLCVRERKSFSGSFEMPSSQ